MATLQTVRALRYTLTLHSARDGRRSEIQYDDLGLAQRFGAECLSDDISRSYTITRNVVQDAAYAVRIPGEHGERWLSRQWFETWTLTRADAARFTTREEAGHALANVVQSISATDVRLAEIVEIA